MIYKISFVYIICFKYCIGWVYKLFLYPYLIMLLVDLNYTISIFCSSLTKGSALGPSIALATACVPNKSFPYRLIFD